MHAQDIWIARLPREVGQNTTSQGPPDRRVPGPLTRYPPAVGFLKRVCSGLVSHSRLEPFGRGKFNLYFPPYSTITQLTLSLFLFLSTYHQRSHPHIISPYRLQSKLHHNNQLHYLLANRRAAVISSDSRPTRLSKTISS